jgi:hypothetical protein
MQEFGPDWVLGPAAQDLHADHRAVALAVRDAATVQAGLHCLCEYESWGAVPITHVLDIGAVLEIKLQALKSHATALACGNYLEASRGQASYRSLLLGGGCTAAEAYACWRPDQGLPPRGGLRTVELYSPPHQSMCSIGLQRLKRWFVAGWSRLCGLAYMQPKGRADGH